MCICMCVCVCARLCVSSRDREVSAISRPYLKGIKWHQQSAAIRFTALLSMSKINLSQSDLN